MNKITLSIVGALVAITMAPKASNAATFGEWLAYCAGGDKDIDALIKKDSLSACALDEGIKSACSVVSGTPWTCSTPSAKPKDKGEMCDQLEIKFEIGAGFKMPGTWQVEGNAKASYTRFTAKTNINICNTAPVIPTPVAEGGEYSAESGDVSFNVSMKIEGSIKVTSPVGISVQLSAAAGCERQTSGHYWKKAEVNSCGTKPTPTATPKDDPTPMSTDVPTPEATATVEEPTPIPTATDSPTPMPTVFDSPTPFSTVAW